jgi:hypothetical protein
MGEARQWGRREATLEISQGQRPWWWFDDNFRPGGDGGNVYKTGPIPASLQDARI